MSPPGGCVNSSTVRSVKLSLSVHQQSGQPPGPLYYRVSSFAVAGGARGAPPVGLDWPPCRSATSAARRIRMESRFCSACGQPLGEPVAERRRGAQDGHDRLLRHRRLDRHRRAARPRVDQQRDAPLLRRDERGARAPRRHRREVHRRRGDGRVRRARRARGRRAARGGAPPPRCSASLELLNDELERRWGVRLRVRTGVNTGEVVVGRPLEGTRLRDRRRGQRRGPPGAGRRPGRDLPRGGDVRARPRRRRRGAGRRARAEGQGRAGAGLPPDRRSTARSRASRGGSTRRSSAASKSSRACGACSTTRSEQRAVRLGDRDRPGRARASRASCTSWSLGRVRERARAAGPLPALRRGHHVLADRRGRPGGRRRSARTTRRTWRRRSCASSCRRRGPGGGRTRRRLGDRAARTRRCGRRRSSGRCASCSRALAAERPAGRRVRRHPLGRGHVPRPARVPGAPRRPSVPMLILCLARPEIGELRPALAGGAADGGARSSSVPLGAEHSRALMQNLLGAAELPAGARRRASPRRPRATRCSSRRCCACWSTRACCSATTAAGEPTADLSELRIPATIEALLAARLDRLAGGEQDVIEGASVIGQEFWPAPSASCSRRPSAPFVGSHVQTLVRKQLVARGGHEFAGERGLPVRPHPDPRRRLCAPAEGVARADARAVRHTGSPSRCGERMVEYEEIVGYHLEQAFRYREELGPDRRRGPRARRRWPRCAARVGGHPRACAAATCPAAVKLLERALALIDAGSPGRLEVMIKLGRCLFELGELRRAETVLEETVEAGGRARRPAASRCARRSSCRTSASGPTPERGMTRGRRPWSSEAMPVFEAAGDERRASPARSSASPTCVAHGPLGEMGETLERALVHATRAGRRADRARASCRDWRAPSTWARRPRTSGIARLRELLARGEAGPATAAAVEAWAIAALEAMRGNAEEARRIWRTCAAASSRSSVR